MDLIWRRERRRGREGGREGGRREGGREGGGRGEGGGGEGGREGGRERERLDIQYLQVYDILQSTPWPLWPCGLLTSEKRLIMRSAFRRRVRKARQQRFLYVSNMAPSSPPITYTKSGVKTKGAHSLLKP